uniref:Uncharacterized protein n=1 Tax=uncultured Thiotrichaceae bacterium TaxID=298394 RepID=A0A6S6UMA4_9GAMM|nr:MAG: Unknown protein [uncultured Thiotrichaceae bacterium]
MNVRLLVAAVLAFSVGIAAFSLFSLSLSSDKPNSNFLTTQAGCDLSYSTCVAKDQHGHEVSISLSPRPVPILKDVAVEVSIQGMEAIRVAQISIEGLNMYMGVQIIPLTLTDTGNFSEQKLTGVLKLPVCTSQKMDWKAALVVQTNTKEYRADYPFTTIAP